MPVARPESSDSRIIAHVDMDCFYVQVEQRKQPHLRGQPTAVVQYNTWKGGALIAVSYEARAYGVKRSMRGDEATQVCPGIQLVQVPIARGKADLGTYRNAGSEVVSILSRKGPCERASIDEVYLDLTDTAEKMLAETPPEGLEVIDEEALKSHILGLDVVQDRRDSKGVVREWFSRSDADYRDKLLACGAIIVADLRLQVLSETEFTCSAGIAHNKMLAKLASGMNKPAQQTVVPHSAVKGLLEPLPVKKMKQLGGKLGSSLQNNLGVNTVGDLLHFSEEKLQEQYGINTGTWLWNIARGISGDEVEGRLLPKSHGSGKTFPGPRALKTMAAVEHWLNELCEELNERLQSDLEQNKRIAHTLTLHARTYKFKDSDSNKNFPSKSCPLRYGTSKIQEDALKLFQAGLREYLGSYRTIYPGDKHNGWGITGLSISASKIFAIPSGTSSIMKYFHNHDQPDSSMTQLKDGLIHADVPFSPSADKCLGSEDYSVMHQAVPQIEFHCQETFNQAEPCFDQLENTSNICKDEEPYGCSSKSVQVGLIQEASPLLAPEAESYLLSDQTDPQTEFQWERSVVKHSMHSVRSQEKRRKMSKEKGTSSILRFFQSQDTYTAVGENLIKTVQQAEASSSGQNESAKNAWTYKIGEIDPAVVNELPLDIQAEVRAWLRPHKLSNTARRGSSITHYFPPTKN